MNATVPPVGKVNTSLTADGQRLRWVLVIWCEVWESKVAVVSCIAVQNLHPVVLTINYVDSSILSNGNIIWAI